MCGILLAAAAAARAISAVQAVVSASLHLTVS